MITPYEVIEEAKLWKGTPFKHQGRTKHGLDCVGFCLVVGWNLGIYDKDHQKYSRYPQGDLLRNNLEEVLTKVKKEDLDIGMIVMMKIDVDPQHMAIITPYSEQSFGMIHSYYKRGVVEHRLSLGWKNRIVSVYKIPGVEY